MQTLTFALAGLLALLALGQAPAFAGQRNAPSPFVTYTDPYTGERMTVYRRNYLVPSNDFDGGYVEGSWTISGEHRKYNPATGAYAGIVPDRPFEPWMNHYGTGAWELAARYSTIDLKNGAPGALGAVGGGQQTVYALGVNWYPNTNLRFMFDFLHGDIGKRFISAATNDTGVAGTPLGAPVGGSFDALAMRMQFAF